MNNPSSTVCRRSKTWSEKKPSCWKPGMQ